MNPIFFKFFSFFLKLPLFFILLLILAIFSKRKKRKRILIFLTFFIYFASLPFFSRLFIFPLENKYPQISERDFKKAKIVVILLGRGKENLTRAVEGFRIYQNLKKGKIIISGRNVFEKTPSQRILAKLLIDLGAKEEDIFLEEKSINTYQSSLNLKKIVGKRPFFLVSSAYHLPRAMETFKKAGLFPIPAPAKKNSFKISIYDFFPQASSFGEIETAFYEYLSLFFYRLIYF